MNPLAFLILFLSLSTSAYAQKQAIAPLIQTKWDQTTPFNNNCPLIDETYHEEAGSVATAMAQLLYYHRPTSGYDWDNMLLDYSNTFSETQANAIATLIYDCGIKAGTEYGTGKKTDDKNVLSALKYNFGVDYDMQYLSREDFTSDEWIRLIDDELEHRRPIYFSASTTTGDVQAFICDGRNSEGKYHINWGRSGKNDGYYDINYIVPLEDDSETYSTPAGYTVDNHIIIGIQKENHTTDSKLFPDRFTQIERPNVNFTKYTRANTRETFSGTITIRLGNYCNNTLKRTVALAVKNQDGTFAIISDRKQIELSSGGYTDSQISINFNYAISTDANQIFIVESEDNTNWHASLGNITYPIEIKVSDTELTLPNYYPSEIEVISVPTVLPAETDAIVSFTMKNTSAIEKSGIIKVRIWTWNDSAQDYGENLFFEPGETKIIQFKYHTPEASTLTFYVIDSYRAILNNSYVEFVEPIIPGDMDNSGTITKSDAEAIADYILGNTEGKNPQAADANEDGKVTIGDVSKVIDKLAK